MIRAEIKKYRDEYRNQILTVWEKSVRQTHDFVKSEDIDYFKKIVGEIDFHSF